MANYGKTTLAQILAVMKERLGGNGVFWPDSEVVIAINEALAVWQVMTGDSTSVYNQTISSNTNVISLDTTVSAMGILLSATIGK